MRKTKLIYNPNAGNKKVAKRLGLTSGLEDIKRLLTRYQIEFDLSETKRANHAYDLAKEAVSKKYQQVIVCGGDGTVNEVAQALVGSDVTLGIIPRGTYMNTASMLSIPFNTEMAVMTIKLQRTRKIDAGVVKVINGTKLKKPFYFLETSGIGLDAEIQRQFKEVEKGKFWKLIDIITTFVTFYSQTMIIEMDGKETRVSSTLVNISNGAYTGANLKLAPDAKLNDHRLTVSLVKMTKMELLLYFLKLGRLSESRQHKIKTEQAEKVLVKTLYPRPVHADATLFGYTPVEYEIMPNAIEVICGFPPLEGDPSLVKKAPLDP